jgi:hypothetical protein
MVGVGDPCEVCVCEVCVGERSDRCWIRTVRQYGGIERGDLCWMRAVRRYGGIVWCGWCSKGR